MSQSSHHADTRACAHDLCHCRIPTSQQFCSVSCEQNAAASQSHMGECHCGHEACQKAQD